MQIDPTKPPTGKKWRLSIFEIALAHASAERNLRSGFPYCGYYESRQYRAVRWFLLPEAGLRQRLDGLSLGQCGGSYCRRPDSVSGWMVSAVCQRLLLTNHFCHSYQPKMAIIPTFSLWFWFAQQLRPCFLQPCRRPSGVRRARAGKTQNPYRAAAYIPLRPDFS